MNKPTIEELEAQVKQLAAENAVKQEFISACFRAAGDGGDMDGNDIQELGERLGLFERQTYQPALHGYICGHEAGEDSVYVMKASPVTDAILLLLAERDADKKRIGDMQAIVDAAEKLVRCKGRYHSEQNYRALAALFGVKTPDMPPLETEVRTVSVKLPAVYDLVGDCDGNGNLNEAEMVASTDGIYARVSDIKAAGIKLEVGE